MGEMLIYALIAVAAHDYVYTMPPTGVAYDWPMFRRTPAGHQAWQVTREANAWLCAYKEKRRG